MTFLWLRRFQAQQDVCTTQTSIFTFPPAGYLHKLDLRTLTSDLSTGDPGASQNNRVVLQRSALCRLCPADTSVSALTLSVYLKLN